MSGEGRRGKRHEADGGMLEIQEGREKLKFFFFKQKTAYEMCGRDWSSDVCSSDLNE